MTTATYTRPDVTVDSSSVYKAKIDAAARVFERIGGAFAAHEQNSGSPSPDLSIRVDAGPILILSGTTPTLAEVAAQTVTGFTVPSAGQHRIDRVVIDQTTGAASRVAGTAVTGSPTASFPAIPTGKLPCCSVLITSANTVITNSMITDERVALPISPNSITLGTEVASTSGTSIDFTGLPAGVKRITINFKGVSVSGSSNPLIQIGDAGGIEATGYLGNGFFFDSSGALTAYTTGFGIRGGAATYVYHGAVVLTLEDSSDFAWVARIVMSDSATPAIFFSAGSKSLSAELDRVRITTVGGTDTFDAGVINISYER